MSLHRRSIAALLLIGAACSGSPAITTTSLDSADLTVTLTEWQFAPADATVARSPATIELRNSGELLHEWALTAQPVAREPDLATAELLVRVEVNAGEVSRLELPALEAGIYHVVCPIPGHITNGMVGTVTVGP